ncbi:mucin-2-like [Ylistrum balloti]|uniref:mucin-2-like n=1 Tax=Ylistrum balloti TaxID=509963 RepID=UPI002905844A|nr:mucin-2-like [Ylistrum balloti]
MSYDIPSPIPMKVTPETTLSDVIEATILDGVTELDDLLDFLSDTVAPHGTTTQTHSETTTTNPHPETTTTNPHPETNTNNPHRDITNNTHYETTTNPHRDITNNTHYETTNTQYEITTTNPHRNTTINSNYETTTNPHRDITNNPQYETTTTNPHRNTTKNPHPEAITTHPPCDTTTTQAHQESTTTRPHQESTTTLAHQDSTTTRPPQDITIDSLLRETTTHNNSTPQKKSARSPISESRPDSIFSLLSSNSPPSTPLLNHPFFCELRTVLLDECKKSATPNSLLSTFQPKSYSTVSDRERRLQQMFKRLHSVHGDEIQQLSSFYRYQAGAVEMERLQSLQDSPTAYHPSVNSYYDNQLHLIMDRVETSLDGLDTTNRERTRHQSEPLTAPSRPLSRPVLSRKAVRLMEEWYYLNTEHPYPSPDVIYRLAEQGHIKEEQVKKWFSNKRSRTHNTKTLSEISKRRRRPQGSPGVIYLPSLDYF